MEDYLQQHNIEEQMTSAINVAIPPGQPVPLDVLSRLSDLLFARTAAPVPTSDSATKSGSAEKAALQAENASLHARVKELTLENEQLKLGSFTHAVPGEEAQIMAGQALLDSGSKPAGGSGAKPGAEAKAAEPHEAPQPWMAIEETVTSHPMQRFGIDTDQTVRVICTEPFVETHGWQAYKEQPLLGLFEGHPNWQDPLLARFWCLQVPLAELLAAGADFCMSSYRWEQITQGPVTGRSAPIAIPGNYAWYLRELEAHSMAGWMDFVAHRQHDDEIASVLAMMGPMYAALPVLPSYLTPSYSSVADLEIALSRGWIFQESAFVRLHPRYVSGFVNAVLVQIASNTVKCDPIVWQRGGPIASEWHASGNFVERKINVPDQLKDNLKRLLALSQRRMHLTAVTNVLIEFCKGLILGRKLAGKELDDNVFGEFFLTQQSEAHYAVGGLTYAHDVATALRGGNMIQVHERLAVMLACCLAEAKAEELEATLPIIVAQLVEILTNPADVAKCYTDLEVAQGVIRGVAETEFTVLADEVVGTLSVIGVMLGVGPPPQASGAVSAAQEQYALKLLHGCWSLVINSKLEFEFFPRRVSPALRAGGLGVLQPPPPDPARAEMCIPCVAGFTRFHELVFSEEPELPSCRAILISRPDGTFSKLRINPRFDPLLDGDTVGEVPGNCYYGCPEGFWARVDVVSSNSANE